MSQAQECALQLHAAKKYRDMNLAVLPVIYGTKTLDGEALRAVGAVLEDGAPTWKAYRSRLPTDDELANWFGEMPRNLALAGRYRGLGAFDFDNVDAFTCWRARHQEFAAQTAIQQSSRGFHVLYFQPRRFEFGHRRQPFVSMDLPDKIIGDIVGLGNYLLVWPSRLWNSTRYRWLPGQAPWEVGIRRLDDFKTVGLKVKGDWKRYPRYFFRLATREPGAKKHWSEWQKRRAGIMHSERHPISQDP